MTRPTSSTFRAAPDLADWRGTFAGVQACFRCDSFAAGVRLVGAIGEAAERTGSHPDVDLRPEGISVTIRHDGTERFTDRDVELARSIAAAARAQGATSDPERVQVVNLFVAHAAEVDVAPFWTAALGYEPYEDGALDPLRRTLPVSFHRIGHGRPGRGRTHVDVSVPAEVAEARVAAALAAGGRLVDASLEPEWWSLASPDNHGVDIAAWPDRGTWDDVEARHPD